MEVTRVAVVGAGLTGLSAGWELLRSGVEPLVLEAEPRAGGVILTERQDGYVIEGGPDGFLAAEPELPALARELGVEDRLVNQLAKGSFLWTGACLEPLEEGRAAALLGITEPLQEDLSKGFQSFAGGMQEIVAALMTRLGPRVRLASAVERVRQSEDRYRLSVAGEEIDAAGLVCAAPAWVVARLLAGLSVGAARALDDVPYHPSLTVSLAYRREQVGADLGGTGFVVASGVETLRLRACTYASLKYPGRAPRDRLLLRVFLAPESDAPAPETVAHAELARILDISGHPLWGRTFYWERGLPRYRPQHAARVATIREQLHQLPPIAIAGAGVERPAVSACVRSGRVAARSVLERLQRP